MQLPPDAPDIDPFRLLVEGMADYAMILMNHTGGILHWNPGAQAIFGYEPSEVMGRPVDVIFTPEDRSAGVPEKELRTAAEQGRSQDLRWHLKQDGSRFWADGILTRLVQPEGAPLKFAKVLRDATADKRTDDTMDQRARTARLISDVGLALTTCHTLAEMLQGCTESVVTHLDAAFARVWTLDENDNVLVLQASAGLYTHLDGPHGRVPVGQFKIGLIAQERLPHLTNAVVGDPRVSDQDWARRECMVAFAGYPLVVEDRLVGVLALFARHALPDVTLEALGAVADQIALGIDRRRSDEALAEANQRTASILESITDAFFALDSQWRFTYLNDQAERLLLRPRAQLLGRSVWDEFPAAVGTSFDQQYHRALDTQTAVTFEEYYPPPLDTWFEVRAYPSPNGLSIYFHDINQRRAQEQERERLLQEAQSQSEREHNIAVQLQTALQPDLPGTVPGVALSRYYEPALAQSEGVGGDFYDVFALEKGCTALVVADVSGKGLSAAAQVAAIRHGLRTALYLMDSLVDAVTRLNDMLAEQNLLTGFATLFVGAYDSGSRVLRYVNAGQEPGLVRRAAGAMIYLNPTGPVLGGFEGAAFTEELVTLTPGDALAVFSDGLTEVGATRLTMLGIDGIAALFALPVSAEDAAETAETLALRLIQGVDAAAQGGVMRDDMCLLVAVIE